MKKIPRIIFDFKGVSDAKTETKGLAIYSGMEGNGNYTGITPTVASMYSALVAFQAAVGAAANGGKAANTMKKQIKENLVSILIDLSNAVLDRAKGDRAILETSGFTISSDTSLKRLLGPIVDFLVVLGKVSGTVKCSCKGVKYRQQYIYQYALTPITESTIWTSVPSSNRTCIIPNLTSMKEYAFRMEARGANDQVSYSETITKIVL